MRRAVPPMVETIQSACSGGGGKVIAQQEARAVGRNVAQRRRGQFIGKRQSRGFAVGDQRLGQHAAAILDLRKINARAVGGCSRKAFKQRIAGRNAAGERDLS